MKKSNKLSSYKYNYGINVDNFKFLGEGHQGKVFLMPNNKVIKLYKKEEACKGEVSILKSVKESKYFPKVYEQEKLFVIREMVKGIEAKKYIKLHGLSEKLALNLISLILEFERLGFKRLDMRLAHIFVQENETVRVIDPRNSYSEKVNRPHHLLKGLSEAKVLNQFMNTLRNHYPEVYKKWKGKK